MKNSDIVKNYTNLTQVINKAASEKKEYPVKVSYAISKNILMLEPEVTLFEQERNKMLDKYNVKDEDGNPEYKKGEKIRIAEEYIDAWEKEIKELMEIDVEVEIHKVNIEEFKGNIGPEILLALDFMIEG